jgi:tetratricopeptide (TPR) repeat protein
MTLSAGREAEGQYSQAIALAVSEGANIEPRRIAAVHYKRQITRVLLGNYLAALSDCQQALIAASETGDEDLLFDVRVNTAYTQLMAERIDEAIKVACEIERSAEPPPGGSKRLRYLNFDVQLKMGLGDLDQAALMGDSAVTLARSLGDAERLLTSLGVRAQLHYHHAEYASALPLLQEVCRLGVDKRRLGDPRPLYIYFGSTVYLGLTLGDLGHVSEALVTLQSGLEMARADGYGFWVPRLLSAIGWVYGDIGALGDALQYAEDAAAEAVGQDTEIRVESRLNLALVYLRLGRMDRAPSLLAEADMLNRQNVLFAWPWRIHYATAAAEDALARGAPVRATELAREGNALARRYGVWKHVIIAERLLAEAAAAEHDWPQAGAHIQQAIDVLTEHPVPILAWKVHAIAARIHRHRGLEPQAAAALEQARDQARQLSERIQEEPLRATFLDSFRHFVGESDEAGTNQ